MKNVLCIFLFVFIVFPIKAEPNFHLKLFITANQQGWWNSKDFYPQSKKRGLAFLIKELHQKKQTYPQALLLDAGDFFYGSARSFYSFQQLPLEKNLFLKNFLNLNYDLINLGNLDLRNLDILDQILAKQKLNLISANLKHPSIQNYKIFHKANKKIFITALSYPEFSLSYSSFSKSSWRFLDWKKSLQQIQKNIKKEKPDFVIGVFHLSRFFSPSNNIPNLEQVVTYFPNWDLLISATIPLSLASRSSSIKTAPSLERIQNIPVATPASKGFGWLELNISLKDKKITAIPHWTQKKTVVVKDGFSKYLQHNTFWRYKGGTDYKRCLEYSFAKAVQGKGANYSILPRLRFQFFSLFTGDTIQRKELFYLLPYFNKRAFVLLSAYDFVKISSLEKKYLLQADTIPEIKGLFERHQKKFLVASSAYTVEKGRDLRNHLLLKSPQKDSDYLHNLWFDYLKNNYPDTKFCGMFEKLRPQGF